MPITCPACNKANQTEAACTRCGCDLTRLHEIVEAAGIGISKANVALRVSDWTSALAAAEQSWQLCHSVLAARLAFLAASALGETTCALLWHQRAR